jgi:hypothetical protein
MALSHWYVSTATPADNEDRAVHLHRVGAVFQALGPDIGFVMDQFSNLDDYERETLDDLRDLGVSVPDVIDYLRAAPGLNPEGLPTRPDVATALRKREFQYKSARIESSGRSAAIFAGSLALLTVGAALVAPVILPAIAPSAAPTITAALTPVLSAIAPFQDGIVEMLKLAAGGGAVAATWKAWNGWQKIRSGAPRLDIGKDSDFKDLPQSLGSMDYARLNDEYEAIPAADRYLLSHLSQTEMRLFLAGNDGVRKHILTASPPAPWAKVQSRLDSLAHGSDAASRIKRLGAVAVVLVTAPYHRAANRGHIPDLDRRLENWRANAEINKTFRTGPALELPAVAAAAQHRAEVQRDQLSSFFPSGRPSKAVVKPKPR